MIEDSALILKRAFDKGEKIDVSRAKEMLDKSELINRLLIEPKQDLNLFVGIRALEWRLIELSEIPLIDKLEKVQDWIKILIDKTYTPEGFSLTGNRNGLLACHNAMITSVLIKVGFKEKEKIETGIYWIIKYQNVERGLNCNWTGLDLNTRFGGCMKSTPCFYGVVKSMISLTEYKKRFGGSVELDNKLKKGLEYILEHRVFKKLSSDKPIEPSIVENFYPYSYKSNLIEVLSLLKANNLLSDNRCAEALEILRHKQRKDGFWQADVSHMKSAWIDFDTLKKPGLWISYILSGLINN